MSSCCEVGLRVSLLPPFSPPSVLSPLLFLPPPFSPPSLLLSAPPSSLFFQTHVLVLSYLFFLLLKKVSPPTLPPLPPLPIPLYIPPSCSMCRGAGVSRCRCLRAPMSIRAAMTGTGMHGVPSLCRLMRCNKGVACSPLWACLTSARKVLLQPRQCVCVRDVSER